VLDAARGEIAQERISGSERKKTQSRAAFRYCPGKQTVDDLIGGAVAAHREKISKPALISAARQVRSLTRAGRLHNFEFNSSLPHTVERKTGELAAAASTCGGIHDGKKSFVHVRARLSVEDRA
jgi:hypothetical protein